MTFDELSLSRCWIAGEMRSGFVVIVWYAWLTVLYSYRFLLRYLGLLFLLELSFGSSSLAFDPAFDLDSQWVKLQFCGVVRFLGLQPTGFSAITWKGAVEL
ncbi:hypothetical protein Bca52824_025118 [Brassica carinata]|uniref:Uncharacterized protein n=1 Tax=Brassica carinata TaxID=52824 RepID=A0A8X7VLN7_BRACI|nr:hypothetical protein Bca52824_025118 [Brassica carinata]